MKVYVGIAKGKTKPIVAGVAYQDEGVTVWQVLFFRSMIGKVLPFTGEGFSTQKEAFDDVCTRLHIKPDELVEMEEEKMEAFIENAVLKKGKSSGPPSYLKIAQQFGELIIMADYASAHQLLTEEAGKTHSPANLKKAVERMIKYMSPKPLKKAQAMEESIMEDWPDKQDKDIAIVYVALVGEGFSEAVILTFVQDGKNILIRDLQWGRP